MVHDNTGSINGTALAGLSAMTLFLVYALYITLRATGLMFTDKNEEDQVILVEMSNKNSSSH